MKQLTYALGVGLAMVLMAGCGSSQPELKGAVYSDQIPVFATAEVKDMMGGTTSALDGSEAVHSLSWWLETKHSMQDVEAWYDEQLPNVEKTQEDWGDGPVTVYSWIPTGGKPGEELSIVLSTKDIQITESVNGEHPDW